MKILCIGDIFGKSGRRALRVLLPGIREEHAVDIVVANGENAAGGRGLTLETSEEILRAGVDVITSGNHIWEQREFLPHLDEERPILRPLNYPPMAPGRGVYRDGTLGVVNLMGRVFMGVDIDDPFRAVDRALEGLAGCKVIIVDLHAEATSEKVAMGWYLDGRVSALVGTHTHVPTADNRVLPGGTAYVSDLGMTGPRNSVIGMKTRDVLQRFHTQMPSRFTPEESGPAVMNSVLIDIDESTGKARSIERIDRIIE
ncbi:MAG: TIGR00282 family metallophosphoesterase [Dehalococcoidia bacterium]|nr:TIGR00282 family metallophosphoesterase [Dehalococcoidia bacterium]